MFQDAVNFGLVFLKIAAGIVAGLYSCLLIGEFGLAQTLLAGVSLGITTGVIIPDVVKKLKDLSDKNKKKDKDNTVDYTNEQPEPSVRTI